MATNPWLIFAGYQAVWLACALGAAAGSNLPGIAASLAFLAVTMLRSPHLRSDTITVLASGTVGLIAESLLKSTGLVGYAATWPTVAVAPPWIVGLWLAFGMTMAPTARLLGDRRNLKAVLLGLVFGPLAYLAGDRLGALEITGSPIASYASLAALWALAFPILLSLRARLPPPPQ